MEITIKENGDNVTLSNDQIDNDNYFDVTIQMENGNTVTTTMPVSDLLSACQAFYDLRKRRLDDESKMK